MFKKKKFKSNATSIGVIGSIDGPTAIFKGNRNVDNFNSRLLSGKGLFKKNMKTTVDNEK